MTGRKNIWYVMVRTGILSVLTGSLLFLCKIPWAGMEECVPFIAYGKMGESENAVIIKKVIQQHVLLYRYAEGKMYMQPMLQNSLEVEEIMLAEARDEEEHLLSYERMEQENSVAAVEKEVVTVSENTQVYEAVNMEKYYDFEKLIQDFYVVDRSTYITPEELNAEWMLKQDLSLGKAEGPQVLIYHTHSQEAYADSVPGDESMTVVGAGAKLAELLEGYGISVLHHKGQYDVENRDYAYANAEKGLQRVLEENPSIEVIIDLHRDGVADDTHLVTQVDGKQTAQFMFFNGLSRLKSAGEIEYLKNENRAGNLAFSFQLQVKSMEYYPGIARNIYLKGYRYNMQYREKSLLVELGAQTNTVEEVYNALPPLAHVISMVLLGE